MSERLIFNSDSEEATDRLGELFAATLNCGLVIALNGQLGSGKTRFVRSLCTALGIDASLVNSPTFVLLQLYSDGQFPVAHFDTYRLADAEEFLAIGAEDYLFGDEWLSLIEWADRVADVLPPDRLTIDISQTSENARRFSFSAGGPVSREILDRLRAKLNGES